MQSLRRIGGASGILAGGAAAWFVVGLSVVYPAVGLTSSVRADPSRYLPLIQEHQIVFWMVNVLGGLLASLLALVLLLALADRFRDAAPDRSQIALTMGIVGVIGFAIGSFLRQTGLGSLAVLYQSNQTPATIAFYAVDGTAGAFQALGGVALGIGALVFGSVMLGIRGYGGVGFLSVVVGTPLVITAFVPQVTVLLIAGVLAMAWLVWTGLLLWMEGASSARGSHIGAPGHLKMMNRGHGERHAV